MAIRDNALRHARIESSVTRNEMGAFKTRHEISRRGRIGERGQGGAERLGLGAKPAHPKLAALIGRGWRERCLQSLAVKESRHQEQRDHGDAGAQVWQCIIVRFP